MSHILSPEITGDDGTGHCVGCGNWVYKINPSCDVCKVWLNYYYTGEKPPRQLPLLAVARSEPVQPPFNSPDQSGEGE